ncbi:MAG: GNAT family N-acetyltransferase [Chloroflexota bacterium]|nr:GNAT family N-acetyltransferase [Chloroflexota bacterium]
MTVVSPESDTACIQREPAELASAWSALAAKRQPPSIFLTPEWIAVARAHEASGPITLALGDRGVAALAHEADGTITLAGGQLTDEQDVIAAPGAEAQIATSVARWIVAQRPPRVRFEYVPEERPTLDAFASVLTAAGYSATRARQTVSPVLDLPESYEAYVRSLGKKARHELRRKVRRLETAGAVSFRFAADAERGEVLDRFFALHRLSRGEKAGFMTPDVERFFRDVADALAPLDRLRLGVLSFDGADVAVLFGFALGRVIALYNAAYDPGLASLSVGIVSHAWAVREAIAQGYGTYDLLRGDEPYKYDLGARDRWLARLDAVRS